MRKGALHQQLRWFPRKNLPIFLIIPPFLSRGVFKAGFFQSQNKIEFFLVALADFRY